MTVQELIEKLNMLIDDGFGDLTVWYDEGEQCREIGSIHQAEIISDGIEFTRKVIVLEE